MIKIDTTQEIIDDFYESIKKKFNPNLKKTINSKVKWEINYQKVDNLILKKLKNYDSDITFKKLITSDYNYLSKLIEFINKNPQRYQLSKPEKDYFLTLYSRINKPKFIKALNIQTCPYCNRNYIFNFTRKGKQEATAQLDHFFDKKSYPYLAVSLYNLIPCCSICNQRKSSKNEKIFHPYTESFNENAKFKLKGISSSKDGTTNFTDYSRIIFEIEVIQNEEKVKKHIEIFNLKNLYNEHKDIIGELIQKQKIYSDSYITELLDKYEGTLFKNREDLLRLITCGYIEDKDLHKRPLSKFIKDISKYLRLI